MDIISKEKRSLIMSRIRSKNTKPEIFVRKFLFSKGFRYRLYRKDLPGRPDIVLVSRKIAIFVQGCFWHSHENCNRSHIPETRQDFWIQKFEKNKARDKKSLDELHSLGWRVLWIWECALANKQAKEKMETALLDWINSDSTFTEIPTRAEMQPETSVQNVD